VITSILTACLIIKQQFYEDSLLLINLFMISPHMTTDEHQLITKYILSLILPTNDELKLVVNDSEI